MALIIIDFIVIFFLSIGDYSHPYDNCGAFFLWAILIVPIALLAIALAIDAIRKK